MWPLRKIKSGAGAADWPAVMATAKAALVSVTMARETVLRDRGFGRCPRPPRRSDMGVIIEVMRRFAASLALARNGSPRGYVFTIKTPENKFIYLTFGAVGSDPLNKDGKGGLGNGHPTTFQN